MRTSFRLAAFVAGPAEGDKQVVVVKFNDDEDLAVDTVAADKDLRDACVALEPYVQSTDRVHVVWEDDGEVKVCPAFGTTGPEIVLEAVTSSEGSMMF